MAVFYSVVEVIEMAIKTEETGKSFYEGVAKKAKHPELRNLFTYLAGEEAKHRETFADLYQTVKEHPQSLPYNWDEMNLYLKAITESRFFLGKNKAINLVRKAQTPKQALASALEFERDTLLFYEEIMNLVSEKSRAVVEKIIAQEKKHIRQLQALRESIRKVR